MCSYNSVLEASDKLCLRNNGMIFKKVFMALANGIKERTWNKKRNLNLFLANYKTQTIKQSRMSK